MKLDKLKELADFFKVNVRTSKGMMQSIDEEGTIDDIINKVKKEEKFTINEIRNYILSQDSLGDVLYFLNAKKIKEANTPKEDEEED